MARTKKGGRYEKLAKKCCHRRKPRMNHGEAADRGSLRTDALIKDSANPAAELTRQVISPASRRRKR